MPLIKLVSNDSETFSVDIDIAMHSRTLKNMFEDLGIDGLEEEIIPLPNVSGIVLKKIIEWIFYHKNDPPITKEEEDIAEKSTILSEWDQNFVDSLDKDTFLSLVLASNYLDISPLMDMCCKHFANQLKGKSINELRATLNLPLSPKEEQSSENAKDDNNLTKEVKEEESKPKSDESVQQNALDASVESMESS